MAQFHRFSLDELDNLMPWERDLYVDMTVQHLKEEKERMERERTART